MMTKVESESEVEQIPDHYYGHGFNDYYITDNGNEVAVPNDFGVPDSWVLLCD